MPDENKHNLLYFEAASMRELFDCMNNWQNEQAKRLLSVSIQQDNGNFCCIALTNPSEVVITDRFARNYAEITRGGSLQVYNPGV